ncbi:MAG: hypothetical protein Q9208_004612 [Pyrenodesmia sp. 3 TL-2023]
MFGCMTYLSLLALLAPILAVPTLAIPPSAAIAKRADASYLILSAHITTTAFQNDHDLSDGIEVFNVTVKGVNPGALPVSCSLVWNPLETTSNYANGPQQVVTKAIPCLDPTVHVNLTRDKVLPWFPWSLTVQLEGFDAAEWFQDKFQNPGLGWEISYGKPDQMNYTPPGIAPANGTLISGTRH